MYIYAAPDFRQYLINFSLRAAAGVCVYGGLCVSSFQQQDIRQ